MSPNEVVRIVLGRWKIVVASVLIAGAIGYVVTKPKPAVVVSSGSGFQGQAVLVQTSSRTTAAGYSISAIALFATGNDVADRAAAELHYKGQALQLLQSITSTADTKVNSITITASANSQDRATEIAGAFAHGLLGFLQAQKVQQNQGAITTAKAQAAALQKQINDLNHQLATTPPASADLVRAQRDAKVRQYSVAYERYQELLAQPAPDPGISIVEIGPSAQTAVHRSIAPKSRKSRLAIVVLFGLLLGLGLTLIIEQLRGRIRSRERAEAAFGFPVLAAIPSARSMRRSALAGLQAMGSGPAASFRLLRGYLESTSATNGATPGDASSNGSKKARTILVTSAVGGDGKTTVVANLAAAYAEAGRSTVAVSADLRHPTLHRMFGAPAVPGLVEAVAAGSLRRDDVHQGNVPGVIVVPSGARVENPVEVLAGDTVGPILKRLASSFDAVIIDTSGLIDASDAVALFGQVDEILVVARVGKTPVEAAKRTGELLRRLGAHVEGVVLVGLGTDWAWRRTKKQTVPAPPSTNGQRRVIDLDATVTMNPVPAAQTKP